jgi:hypothetical protein
MSLVITANGVSGVTNLNLYDLDSIIITPAVSSQTFYLYKLNYDSESRSELKETITSQALSAYDPLIDRYTIINYFSWESNLLKLNNISLDSDSFYEISNFIPTVAVSAQPSSNNIRFQTSFVPIDTETYQTNAIDIVYKLNRIADILELENNFLNGEIYNYQLNPVTYEPVSKKYFKSSDTKY